MVSTELLDVKDSTFPFPECSLLVSLTSVDLLRLEFELLSPDVWNLDSCFEDLSPEIEKTYFKEYTDAIQFTP
jgi:hypothetical protein